tara:strand:+ start:266 stop:529 length:264 start_codon:yes stop_codon:yes gene_type:complete
MKNKFKNRLSHLPDEIVNYIFEFTNPYKENHEQCMFRLSWDHYWYKYLSTCFYSTKNKGFAAHYFLKRKEDKELGIDFIPVNIKIPK